MGAQRASAQGPSSDTPDGFGVAVVREEGQWRCSAMAPKSLTSLADAETELRELRSAGAVFGLLDVDDLLTEYAEELKATDQAEEAVRILELAANAPESFLMVVPHKVQADPSISTE